MMTECMATSKRNKPRCEQQNESAEIKQLRKFKSIGNDLLQNRKCD